MKKVIITGAGGFIGGALARRLLSKNTVVYGIDLDADRMKRFAEYSNFIPIEADFTKYNLISQKINDDIDVFYHFAWQGGFSPDALKDYTIQLNNAIAASEAVNQASKIGCKKYVFAGSCNEYEVIPYIHSTDIKPRYACVYSVSKLASELIGKTYSYNCGMEYCSGMIAMPYGENNTARNLSNIVISQLCKGISPKLIEGNNLYDLIYVDDVAEAFIAIGEKGHNMTEYYVGHRNLKTFKELINEIGQILSPKTELQFGTYKVASNLDYSKFDLDALYNDTGFECKANFKESILKTAEWVKTLNWGV